MQSKSNTILLIYPTHYKVTGLPVGLASLASNLRRGGFEVLVFDTCFYKDEVKDQESTRASILSTKKIKNENVYWKPKTSDLKEDIIALINKSRPIVVGITVLENTFRLSLEIINHIKECINDLIVVAGGIFPTLSPDMLINESSIDIVCIGEGEKSIVNLCNKIKNNEDLSSVEGFWVKKNGTVNKNKSLGLTDINKNPFPDFSVFDESLFYKPMQGRLLKMIFIEAARGCALKCPYCDNSKLKEYYADNTFGNYYRYMDINRIIEQIEYQVEKHSPDFIYFTSADFLGTSDRKIEQFVNKYAKIKLPFTFQTRLETITSKRIKALKDVGLFWVRTGVEHGNDAFRRKMLDRKYSNSYVIETVEVLKENNMGASMQNMMGFPFENREMIFDTINLNRKMYQIYKKLQFNIYIFTPFRSTALYGLCKEENLLPKDDSFVNDNGPMDGETPLAFPGSYKKELKGLWRTFNLYVKLPEEYDAQIRIAERDDEEGRKMFNYLSGVMSDCEYEIEFDNYDNVECL